VTAGTLPLILGAASVLRAADRFASLPVAGDVRAVVHNLLWSAAEPANVQLDRCADAVLQLADAATRAAGEAQMLTGTAVPDTAPGRAADVADLICALEASTAAMRETATITRRHLGDETPVDEVAGVAQISPGDLRAAGGSTGPRCDEGFDDFNRATREGCGNSDE